MRTILLVGIMVVILLLGLFGTAYGSEARPVNQKRNVIHGLRKVDWSDVTKQNEFVGCMISAMEKLGKEYDHNYLACISGCAFRACSDKRGLNPSAYHVTNDAAVITHTFKMLGYRFTLHNRSDFETDKKLILDSIDRGVPVLTFHGVATWSECTIISGYEDYGAVLLGYSSFCDYSKPRDSEYFRFSNWHDGWFKEGNGRILIIGEPTKSLNKEQIIRESLKLAVKLIRGTACKSGNYVTGYAGHTKYAEFVCTYEPSQSGRLSPDAPDWDLLYTALATNLGTLYRDKMYVAPFLRDAKTVLKDKANTLDECAKLYDQISDLVSEMLKLIPDDLSLGRGVMDRDLRKQYAQRVLKIRDLEKNAADLLGKI